jgi:voltage-gated potassium channel
MLNQPSKTPTLRVKAYQLLESETTSSTVAKLITFFLITLIITNVAAAITASEPDYFLLYKDALLQFELVSLFIFCVEYLLRVWCAVEATEYNNISAFKSRVKYIFTPIALIDLIAILPFLIAMVFAIDLRALRLIRVLRLLKLTHYFKGFNIFATVIIKESRSIMAAMMVMLFFIIIAASIMQFVEGKAQPGHFGSIMQSFWWAVVTMTTVGYGDVIPITAIGKVISTFIMLAGVALVALPAGMLAGRFGEELRQRKENLDAQITKVLADGPIDMEDYEALERLANQLEIDPEDLQHSIIQLKQGHHSGKCPHCGK